MLSLARLKELLSHDPVTGFFTWLVANNNSTKVGDRAGCLDKINGSRQISIDGKIYLEHRLAWFYVHGEWPPKEIDHINCKKDDNRLENLRLATRSESKYNAKKNKNNQSGYKGVCSHKATGKWQAQIGHQGRVIYLGLWDTPEEAHAAYCTAAMLLAGDFFNAG